MALFDPVLPASRIYRGFRVIVLFARMLRSSCAPDTVHARQSGVPFGRRWRFAAHAASELDGHRRPFARCGALAIWGFLMPLFAWCVTDMTASSPPALSGYFHWRPWWLLGMLVGAARLHGRWRAGLVRPLDQSDIPAALLAGAVWVALGVDRKA